MFKFKVSGRLFSILGDQNISNETAAFWELIKNALDADAKKITIAFEKVTSPGGMIRVSDDGHGMTEAEIEKYWMTICTDTKLKNTRSKSGSRRVLGELGIGRLSCVKIAASTKMTSSPKGESESYVLDIKWDDLINGENIAEGEIDSKTEQKNPAECGLDLLLYGVRKSWSREKILKLKNDLGSYLLPTPTKDNGFKIFVSAPEYELEDEQVLVTGAEIAPYKIRADFDGNETKIQISHFENGKKIDETLDSIVYEKNPKTCGPLKLEISFYPQDQDASTKWEEFYSKHCPNPDMHAWLVKNAGVYLYRDGAWMKPYGGSFDWLNLERRRVSRMSHIGNSSVFGRVMIFQDKNPGIRPTANREVLQQNQELEDLKYVIVDCVKILEKFKEDIKRSERKQQPNFTETEKMTSANIDSALRTVKKSQATETEKNVIKTYMSALKSQIKNLEITKKEEVTEFVEFRRVRDHIAALGMTTAYFAHHVFDPIVDNRKILLEVQEWIAHKDRDKPLTEEEWERSDGWMDNSIKNAETVDRFMTWFRDYINSSAVQKSTFGKLHDIKIRQVVDAFKPLIKDQKIQVEYEEEPENLVVGFYRVSLDAIISILFTNSITSLEQKTDGSKIIHIEAKYKDGLSLRFSDNGIGLQGKDQDEIFEPFVTAHVTADDSSVGHGLGLPLARKIVERNKGTIKAIEKKFDTGVTIEVKFPAESAPLRV